MENIQAYTSAKTSINSAKLPAIYKKINWEAIKESCGNKTPSVFDYGCGKYTDHIESFLRDKGFVYIGYDPYNKPAKENSIALCCKNPAVYICSNVLNVVQENEIVRYIHNFVKNEDSKNSFYFITVYEGDGSGIGRKSQDDCWQRNQKAKSYCDKEEVVYKGVITNSNNKKFVK